MTIQGSSRLNFCAMAAMATVACASDDALGQGDWADRSAQQIKALEAENARLRRRLAEAERERDQLKATNARVSETAGSVTAAEKPLRAAGT
jgi:small-conductance mechanosensitive channel